MSRAHRISALASAVGVAISVYLLSIRLIGVPAICGPALGPFGGCSKVEASAWSSIGPIESASGNKRRTGAPQPGTNRLPTRATC